MEEKEVQELSPDDVWQRYFYEQARHGMVYWRGVQLVKHPMDMVVFAEVIHTVMPRVIIETGTRTGGSALFFADMMKIGGVPAGRVVTVDVAEPDTPFTDERIRFLRGSSVNLEVLDEVHTLAANRAPRMVMLDSDHSPEHVYAELEAYHYLVTPGSYLIVEDTNIANPVDRVIAEFGDGPRVALEKWLPDHPEFVPDRFRERFGVTFNPGAWLRRVA